MASVFPSNRTVLPALLLALPLSAVSLAHSGSDDGDDEYRFLAGLIDKEMYDMAIVEGAKQIPKGAKERILKRLDQPEVPAQMVNRLEARAKAAANGDSNAAPETVELSEDQRSRMIAFVEANTQMPQDRKTIVLEMLRQPRVPKGMVDRITERMGS